MMPHPSSAPLAMLMYPADSLSPLTLQTLLPHLGSDVQGLAEVASVLLVVGPEWALLQSLVRAGYTLLQKLETVVDAGWVLLVVLYMAYCQIPEATVSLELADRVHMAAVVVGMADTHPLVLTMLVVPRCMLVEHRELAAHKQASVVPAEATDSSVVDWA
jgi:hypothetical protein